MTTDRPMTRERGPTLRRDRAGDADVAGERVGASPGTIRALFTLAGVAVAGFLLWLASTFDWRETTGDFWVAMALIAGAGLVLGLSQLFGGWTKWGWPTMSPGMFLFAFLPTLIVGGWILLAKQPQGGVEEGRFDRWSGDLGISGLVNDLNEVLPAIPLIIGLVLAFTFDTTGPRRRIVRRDAGVPDEDVHDYRRETPTATTTGTRDEAVGARTGDRDRSVAEELRTGDRPGTTTTETDVRDPDRRDAV